MLDTEMTFEDYFAAKAMQFFLEQQADYVDVWDRETINTVGQEVAWASYRMARKMVEERERLLSIKKDIEEDRRLTGDDGR